MHILIVTQYFWPENFRINDVAGWLVEKGHQVTVLTGVPNYPEGALFDGYGYFNKQQNYNGVKVLRVPLIPRGNGGKLRLVLNYISFAVLASVVAPFICKEKYDLIFVFQMSPITQALPALLLSKIYNCPLVLWVQDLWPESLSATGAIKSKQILAIVAMLVKFIYQRCDRILIQSNSFSSSVQHYGGNKNKIFYLPYSAESIFSECVLESNLPPVPSGFSVMFAGNIGVAQDFETIVSAAEMLQEYADVSFIIIGDGRERKSVEDMVQKKGLDNIHFLGRYPLELMPSFFAKADSMLVTLKREPIFALTIPAKIQSYLACGKPIIAALDGEGANVILESGAGFVCSSGAADELARLVLKMYRLTKSEREDMGAKGRDYYEANFNRDMLLDRLEGWMRELVKGK